MKTFTLDASGKKLGRLATEAAVLLMGKNEPTFSKNKVYAAKVIVKNCAKLAVSHKKKISKSYVSYTGYPGGLKKESLSQVITRFGKGQAFKRAVFGMLPKNKLRAKIVKNLIIED